MARAADRRLAVGGIATLIGLTLSACNAAEPDTTNQAAIQPMLGAVENSRTEDVRRLAEQHIGLNERSPENNTTPTIFAATTDQWPVVEILIDHGADIWAHDEFGVTAAQFAPDSRILRVQGRPGTRACDRQAESARLSFPPPDADQVLALEQRGEWPPHEKERP